MHRNSHHSTETVELVSLSGGLFPVVFVFCCFCFCTPALPSPISPDWSFLSADLRCLCGSMNSWLYPLTRDIDKVLRACTCIRSATRFKSKVVCVCVWVCACAHMCDMSYITLRKCKHACINIFPQCPV